MKHHEQHARLAFDEQRALEELQRLHREIQRARGDRERAEGEFDAFVRGFRDGAPPPAPARHRAREPRVDFRSEIGTRGAVESSEFDPRQLDADPVTGQPAYVSDAGIEASPRPVAVARPRLTRGVVLLAAAAVTVAAVVLGVRARRVAPPPAQDTPRTVATVPAPAPSVDQRVPAPAASGVNLELVTRRAVWVRVTIDGRRLFEREVPAGRRIPLHGDRSITIRAGDAGALAIVRNGRDEGALGAAGAVITREYQVSSARDRTPVR